MRPTQETTPEHWHVTLKEMSEFYGTSVSTLSSRMILDDFPSDAQVGRGIYDLKKYNDWYMSHFFGNEEESSLGVEKLRKLRAEADMKEMERDERSKKLLDIDKVVDDLSFVLNGIKQRLLSWSKGLPPHLIGRDEKEIGEALRIETRAILEDLSRGIVAITPKKTKKTTKKKKVIAK